MKKSLLLLLGLIVSLPVLSQQYRLVKKNLEIKTIDSSSGSIDSLVTEIVGNYSYATFHVTVFSARDYYASFWLMGYKRPDNNYSTYDLMIDGVSSGITISSSKADWQFVSIPNNGKISLSVGSHQIALRGLKSDIPNVENLSLSIFQPTILLNTYNARYQYAKTHHSAYAGSSPSVPLDIYREINYFANNNDSIYPPSLYHGELNKNIFYTFYRLLFFEQGETVTLSTDTIGGKHHYLHLVGLENPLNHSWVASSLSNGHSIINQTIPATGFYYVLVRAFEPEDWGTCNLSVNGNSLFEDIPIVDQLTEVPPSFINGRIYTCFATSSNINPMIWLIGNSNEIVNFNDDYPYDPNNSSYDWKRNARVNHTLDSGMKVLATLEKSYQNGRNSSTDVYAGGRIRYWNYYYYFPNLKQDDHIITGDADSTYNCMAWALGEWSDNFRFSKLYGSEPYYVEVLDSVCAIYGYTRTGATEANAQIDLWAIVENGEWNCKHFSVRKKAHQFAGSYDWESKLGGLERIMHPRNDLRGAEYGEIVAHYRKDNSLIGPVVNDSIILRQFENVSFTEGENEIIQKGISQIPEKYKTRFLQLYESCLKEGMEKLTLFIDVFQKTEGYKELIGLCEENALLKFLLFKKIDEGEVLAIQLMEDLVAKPNIMLFRKVQEESAKRRQTKDGYRIVRTLQANSMLFIKAYLAESMKYEYQVKNDLTYSNTDVFHVSTNGRDISISLNLENEAYVSAVIGNTSGAFIKNIQNRKHYEAGNVVFKASVPTSGVYIVNVLINGRNYEKVINIK